MARIQKVTIVDDLDGSELPSGTPSTRFSLNGTSYELDLGEASSSQLKAALAPFIGKARKVGGVAARRAGSARAAGNSDSAKVRSWAVDRGMAVPSRGRIPKAILDAYEAEH